MIRSLYLKTKPLFLRLPVWARIALPAAVLLLLFWLLKPGVTINIPGAVVQSGEFVIDLKVTGRVRAENSVFISAPPARSNLQIIDLVDEGKYVQEGDFLIQFDTTEVRQQIDDAIADLDLARSNLERSRASMDSRMASLESSLENSRASYRLAELRLEQMKFEADIRIEEGQLQLQQAKISLQQASKEIEAQRKIDLADIYNLELKVKQATLDLEKLRSDLTKLTVRAPKPGLVVYKETWRGGESSKIKIGDSPWRSQTLIELPDLSVMMVATTVSELDVAKVKVGLPVEVKLDAYPDPVFEGEVTDVAVLARADMSASDARLFDVLVRLKKSDPILRPGMSASARIIVDRIPNKLWIPIEAVFEKDGKMKVFEKTGSGYDERIVKLGMRNDNFVIVEEGLSAGQRVALVDPTSNIDETAAGVKSEKKNRLDNNNSNNATSTSGTSSSGQSRPPRSDGRPRAPR